MYIHANIRSSHLPYSLYVYVICADLCKCFRRLCIYIFPIPHPLTLFKWNYWNNFNSIMRLYRDIMSWYIMIASLSFTQGNTQSSSKSWSYPPMYVYPLNQRGEVSHNFNYILLFLQPIFFFKNHVRVIFEKIISLVLLYPPPISRS